MIVIDNDNKDEDNNENNNVVDYDCDDGQLICINCEFDYRQICSILKPHRQNINFEKKNNIKENVFGDQYLVPSWKLYYIPRSFIYVIFNA